MRGVSASMDPPLAGLLFSPLEPGGGAQRRGCGGTWRGPRFRAAESWAVSGKARKWRWPRRLASAPASVDTVAAFRPWRGFRPSVARGRRGHHGRGPRRARPLELAERGDSLGAARLALRASSPCKPLRGLSNPRGFSPPPQAAGETHAAWTISTLWNWRREGPRFSLPKAPNSSQSDHLTR